MEFKFLISRYGIELEFVEDFKFAKKASDYTDILNDIKLY